MTVAAIAILGKEARWRALPPTVLALMWRPFAQNDPILVRAFGQEDELRFHLIAHTALDFGPCGFDLSLCGPPPG